ncbi:hypothetical protein [Arthrobacter sp. B10-11]|uniref:hypothetical protein n=1 Tax=Arthrobacter sp. B10-11 TaxID=3081160 RepID=UPI002953B2F0|nr:hypothetical protein [Arthrobacter sp. B10-11]MDV8146974.1 hypothetical protein [Arthrobacter sp. B10-11]
MQVVVTGVIDHSLRNRFAPRTADSWVAGDVVFAECEFETDAAGWAATVFNLNLALCNVPEGSVTRSADVIHIGSPASTFRPATGIFRIPPLTIVADKTHLELNVVLKGSGTYRIDRAAIKRVMLSAAR